MCSRRSRPLWPLARVRRASMRLSCCRLEARSSRPVDFQTSGVEGSPRATCTRVRSRVSGVRSSWEALATKCRCASNAASRRAKRSSRVSPSCLNSSSAFSSANRSWRFDAEILRAVEVISRTGFITRPATSHPKNARSRRRLPALWPRRSTVGVRTRRGSLLARQLPWRTAVSAADVAAGRLGFGH